MSLQLPVLDKILSAHSRNDLYSFHCWARRVPRVRLRCRKTRRQFPQRGPSAKKEDARIKGKRKDEFRRSRHCRRYCRREDHQVRSLSLCNRIILTHFVRDAITTRYPDHAVSILLTISTVLNVSSSLLAKNHTVQAKRDDFSWEMVPRGMSHLASTNIFPTARQDCWSNWWHSQYDTYVYVTRD